MTNLLSITAPNVIPTLRSINNNEYDYQRCLFLYDSISLRMNRKDLNDNLITSVPLHRNFLHDILGKDYLKIIQRMIHGGIIERSDSYQEGTRAKAVSIMDDYLIGVQDKPIFRTITDYKLVRRFNKFYKNQLYFNPKFSHVQDNLNAINIDTDKVDEWIQKEYDDSEFDKRKAHIYKHSVGKIINEKIIYKRSQNGRLHSAMTVLKKELRTFLFDRSDGTFDFVEVDISNCQLCMLSLFLLKNFPIEVKTKNDYKLWGELCFSGQIYDYISKQISRSRNIVKQNFMEAFLYTKDNKSYILNSKNRLSLQEQEWAYFLRYIREEFPTIWNMVFSIKRKIGQSRFAIEIQRMESKLMIDRVLSKTKKFGTHFTIHDSLVCRSVDQESAIDLINNESIKLYGIKMPLKRSAL